MPYRVKRYHMTPTRLRERLAEAEDRVDAEQYVAAMQAVRGRDPERRR
jgi:hypothetical protein